LPFASLFSGLSTMVVAGFGSNAQG